MRFVLAVLLILVFEGNANADSELYAGEKLFRPPLEWSTWLRGSIGVRNQGVVNQPEDVGATDQGAVNRPESNGATSSKRSGEWEGGVGIEASLALTAGGNVRLGGFGELRGLGLSNAFVGGEVVITRVPKRMDMFLYKGHGILSMRGGQSSTHRTVSIAYGYLVPFWLEGECRVRFYGVETGVCEQRTKRHTRYMSGVRLVGTWTAPTDNNADFVATVGLEFEPAAAIRMFGAMRSWY